MFWQCSNLNFKNKYFVFIFFGLGSQCKLYIITVFKIFKNTLDNSLSILMMLQNTFIVGLRENMNK